MEVTIEKNNMGVHHFLNNDFKSAEDYYKEALDKDERNTSALNNIGLLYHQEGKFEKAVEYFNKALAIDPKDTYYLNLANSLVYLDKYVEAEDNYMKSLKINPNNENSKISLAKFYEFTRNVGKATVIWENLVNTSNKESFKISLARNYMALGNFKNALSLLSYTISINESALVLSYIGVCEFNLKNYGLAETAFKKSLSLEPNNYKTRHYLAINYLSKGDYANSIKELKILIKWNPKDIKVKLDKATICLNIKKYREALDEIHGVLELDPENKKANKYKSLVDELMKTEI